MGENIPVVLKVVEIKIQTQYGLKGLTVAPIENLLYQIDLSKTVMTESPNGYIVTQGGLTMILRALEGVLNAEF